MRYVIIRADGGISLPSNVGDDASMDVALGKWRQSARAEWLPATWDKTNDPLPDPVFHGSRATRGPRGQPMDNGWSWDAINKRVFADMPKCREAWREKLRAARVPKMAALDVAYLRADETGDIAEKARIAAQKQALRDVTDDPAIEAATNTEELKAVIPDILK